MSETLILRDDRDGVATLTLNRPRARNALSHAMLTALSEEFARLAADESVRAVVLAGAGRSFSAGADVEWMRRMAHHTPEDNLADAAALAALMHALDRLPLALS